MKIAGVVAEYNPFHNGHLLHLEETRAQSRCDAVVAALSGNFVQRGEPAAFDKWARARMALECGADAVFELPAFYALQPAEWFAFGGVALLHGLGADVLSFGAEQPDLASLKRLADLWNDEPDEIRTAIRERMAEGKPHPRARAEALEEAFGGEASALSAPNSVLAAMYLKQLKALGSAMEPLAVRRVEAGYHDEEILGSIASATAVRKGLFSGVDWRRAVPDAAARILEEEISSGAGPAREEELGALLLHALRAGAEPPDRAEGLHRRMAKAARESGTISEFYAAAKCKRYTLARIKRAAMLALLSVTADDVEMIRREKPVYARLLGYSRRAEGLVGELARRATVPLVTRAAEFRPSTPAMQRLWEIDLMASDVYALGVKNPALRRAGRDFTERMIVL